MKIARAFPLLGVIAIATLALPRDNSAMAQTHNDLDAMVYGQPDVPPPPPVIYAAPRRGLFTGSSSPGGAFTALREGFGSTKQLFASSRPSAESDQSYRPPQSSGAIAALRNSFGARESAAASREAPPPPQAGLAVPVPPGGAFAAIRANFGAPRRSYGPPPVVYAAPPPLPVPAYDAAYRIDSGDKMRVVVYGQEGLTNSYAVGASGAITMPLIGNVAARGLTPAELAGAITGRLRDGFIRDPSVAVEIEAYRPFFILGEVAAPGQYPYVPNMSVESAVAIAGGFSPRAKRDRVTLTHTDVNGTLRAAVSPGTPINPGDTIVVGERWF